MRKIIVLTFAITCSAMLSACFSDPEEPLIGAWKTETPDTLTGKASTLVISKTELSNGADSAKVEFSERNGSILICRLGEQKPIFIATVIDKNRVRFDNLFQGNRVFIRTTPEDVKAIEAAPDAIRSKADPF